MRRAFAILLLAGLLAILCSRWPALRVRRLERSPHDNAATTPVLPSLPPMAASPGQPAAAVAAVSPRAPPAAAQFMFNEQRFEAAQPSDGLARELLAAAAQRVEGRGPLVLLGLRGEPGAATRTAAARLGVHLLRYVPDGAWIARLDAESMTDPAATLAWAAERVTALAPFGPALRIDPRLRADAQPDEVPVYVHLADDADGARVRDELARRGASLGPGAGYLAGRIERASLASAMDLLGRHPDVQYVERGSGARLLNNYSTRILQSGSYTGPLPVYAHGLYGSNQTIAVLDTGIDCDSCFFRESSGDRPPTNFPGGVSVDRARRKIIACDFWKPGDDPGNVTQWDDLFHGTRVAGHAAGSDLSFPVGTNQYNGSAPGAWLVVQDAGYLVDNCGDIPGMGCPVTNFLPALRQAYAQGARIHNNSWGDNENAGAGTQNVYSAVSAELDAMTWSNRDLLVVCAAGNSGADDIVGSPSTAKNGLSVAAGRPGASAQQIASFSSRGWTKDGRVKPDLAAPGESVTSGNNDGNITTLNCTVSTGSGTSYASPLAAGLAALVRDYFAQGFYPGGAASPADARTNVSAALVKAMLINSCVDMSGAAARPPARDQGWGRPQLDRVLAFTSTAVRVFAEDGAAVFASTPALPVIRGFEVTGTAQPVRVTLAWTDYPGTTGAGKQLINDLDLIVRTPAATYLGNALSNGISRVGGAADHSNNVEVVVLPGGYTGLVEVSVWAHVLPAPTQDFALVVSGVLTNLSGDADGDGMPEYWEAWHFRGGPPADAASDHDGDGLSDAAEYAAGSDPMSALSAVVWSSVAAGDAGVELTAWLPPGRRFDVFWAAGEQPGLYQPFQAAAEGGGIHITGVPGTGEWSTFIDSLSATNGSGDAVPGARFYQLHATGPL